MRRTVALSMAAGLAALVLSLSKFHASSIADPPYDYTASSRFPWSVVFIVLLVGSAYALGLPDSNRIRRQAAMASIGAPILATLGISIAQLALGASLLPRLVVGGTVIASVPWLMLCWFASHGGSARAAKRDRIVLVASVEDEASLRWELERSQERPASLVASFTPADAAITSNGDFPIVGVVHDREATLVVLDRSAQADQSIVDQVALLHETGVRVRTLSLFYDEWLGKLPVTELERVSLMFDIGELHRMRYGRLKRMVDVVVAIAAMPVLLAVWLMVIVGNRFANPGPVLFRQVRVGKGGTNFEILKFRSMVESTGDSSWTADGDRRITAFGGFLRRTHADELPQVINILRGDLSIVGPRPEQPQYVTELRAKLPYYDLRHLVQPGLTGWAQVKYGYASNEGDALEKLQYEFWYLRHQGLALDARILVRTVRSVVGRDGR